MEEIHMHYIPSWQEGDELIIMDMKQKEIGRGKLVSFKEGDDFTAYHFTNGACIAEGDHIVKKGDTQYKIRAIKK